MGLGAPDLRQVPVTRHVVVEIEGISARELGSCSVHEGAVGAPNVSVTSLR
jgi:hypothetical protein